MAEHMNNKTIEEIDIEFAEAIQDYYFAQGAVLNKEVWDKTLYMIRRYRHRLTTLQSHHKEEVKKAREEACSGKFFTRVDINEEVHIPVELIEHIEKRAREDERKVIANWLVHQ